MSWEEIWAWVCGKDSDRDLLVQALKVSAETLSEKLLDEAQINRNLQRELEISKARQISAEAISSERKSEILRLIEELRLSRELLQSVQAERLKSLDSLNLRLLNPSSKETPDLAAFKELQEKAFEAGSQRGASVAVMGAVRSLKAQSAVVDRALLAKLHPKFREPSSSPSSSLPPEPVLDGVS